MIFGMFLLLMKFVKFFFPVVFHRSPSHEPLLNNLGSKAASSTMCSSCAKNIHVGYETTKWTDHMNDEDGAWKDKASMFASPRVTPGPWER